VPKVSICIPTFNSSKYIFECLNSVKEQTYKDFEVIVTDNDSSDDTLEIVDLFKGLNLKVYKNDQNFGIGKNFNMACSKANGELIKLLPSDDIIYPKSLEQSINYFSQYKNISMVMTSKDLINNQSKIIYKNFSSLNTGFYNGKDIAKKILYSGRNPLGEPGYSLIKKESYLKAGGFNENLSFTLDIDLWMRILEHEDIFYINKPLGGFRIHPSSLSTNQNEYKQYQDWIKNYNGSISISKKQKRLIITKIYFMHKLKQLYYKIFS